jgi:outer membrane receptor protein involved in Fe transport
VGFTLTPSFIPGFAGSMDYYVIKQNNTIAKVPLQFSLDQCLNTGNLCGNVQRGPSGGLFGTAIGAGYIVGTAVNVGAGETSGIDFQATYKLPLSRIGLSDNIGTVDFVFVGSELLKATTTPTPGAHTYDCAGLFGPTCQTVAPKWRHSLRTSWQTPWDVLLSANWRYFGGTDYEKNTNDPTLSNGKHDSFDAHLKAVSYLDLSGIWNVRQGLAIRAGINNVFDKDPQVLDSAIVGVGLPNSYPSYDLLGRSMFVGLTANF